MSELAKLFDPIGVEEIASWFTPMEAAEIAETVLGRQSAFKAIWERLVGGMIQAVATTSSLMPKNKAPMPRGTQ